MIEKEQESDLSLQRLTQCRVVIALNNPTADSSVGTVDDIGTDLEVRVGAVIMVEVTAVNSL